MRANARATRQSLASARDTERAIAIAERNADATITLATASEKNAKIQLRAYLTVERVMCTLATEDLMTIDITVKNNGATPSKEGFFLWAYLLGDHPTQHPYDVGPDPAPHPYFRDVIPGSGESTIRLWINDKSVLPHVLPGNVSKSLYLYGYIRYRDIFGELHTTKYCYRSGVGDPLTEGWWAHNPHGNDAD